MHSRDRSASLLCVIVAVFASLAAACEPTAAHDAARATAPTAVDTGRIMVDGTSLYYEAAGQGTPVVLLHAAFVDRRMWDDQFAALARDFRVIRFDARGHGRSGPAAHPFERSADLLALLRALGLSRATLVGCSLGGATAIDFALAHPGMVERLVLVGTGVSGYAWPPSDTMHRAPVTARAALARGDTVGVARAWLLTDYLAAAREQPALAARLDTLLADNVAYWKGLIRDGDHEREPAAPALPRLATIRVPTLVVVGTRDEPDILRIADSLTAKLPRVRLERFVGAGHVPSMEQPARFTALLRDFLTHSGTP